MIPPAFSRAGWAGLLALALIWGGSFLGFAIALRELDVFSVVAIRVAGGMIVLWGVVLCLRLNVPRTLKLWSALLTMGALNNAIPFSLIAWGQVHIESGLASILNGTTAFFGILLAAIAFADERLTSHKIIGVSLAFCGVCLVIGMDALRSFDIRSLAQLAVLCASLSYACASVWARAHLSGIHPFVAATGMLTGSTIIMVPLALLVDGVPTALPSASVLWSLVFLAVPATAMAYMLYYKTLTLVGSGNLMLVTLLIPPIAVALGAGILGERLAPSAFVGFATIAFGMLFIDGRLINRLRN